MGIPEIHLIAGARPNFMKVAPVYHIMKGADWCRVQLVHTGQHYDPNMSDAFLEDLGLPSPDFLLGVGSGTHAEQTAGVMRAYEKVCLEQRPDWIIVVGDVNSTMACALVGTKLWIPVAHLEAGLRSRDRRMPEEINRIVTDAICDLLWTPSPDADENLRAEGVPQERIERVGNIMIDSFELLRERIERDETRIGMGLQNGGYAVITLHRPSNVDDAPTLAGIVEQLAEVSRALPVVFPLHPRTRKRLQEFQLLETLDRAPGVHLSEPLRYVEFMNLVTGSALVVTDSGGVQEETTYLGIPCLTLRDSTERPITVSQGTNKLVEPGRVLQNVTAVLRGNWPDGRRPELWDGATAARIADSLRARLAAVS
jgi:UDP-N-acetylglucosamine 2-epimerase (non-hydrolysing)